MICPCWLIVAVVVGFVAGIAVAPTGGDIWPD
jgi:hypothetical protein